MSPTLPLTILLLATLTLAFTLLLAAMERRSRLVASPTLARDLLDEPQRRLFERSLAPELPPQAARQVRRALIVALHHRHRGDPHHLVAPLHAAAEQAVDAPTPQTVRALEHLVRRAWGC